MKAETKYTALTSWAVISTANTNLDGTTGVYGTVVNGDGDGTLIKSIIIKSQVSTTTNGMIRLFVKNDGTPDSNVNLLMEIPIPIVTKSSRDCSYYTVIPLNYTLGKFGKLLASTELGNTFNVIAECVFWNYNTPAPIADTIQFVANTQGEKILVANSNLNGTGLGLVTIFTADTAANGYYGCQITSIQIKAQQTVTPGMVRLFLQDDATPATTPVLFCEIIIPALTQNGINSSFSHEVITHGNFVIQCGYSIVAATENAETFSVVIKGSDWLYP
jgi:hypothetical protein